MLEGEFMSKVDSAPIQEDSVLTADQVDLQQGARSPLDPCGHSGDSCGNCVPHARPGLSKSSAPVEQGSAVALAACHVDVVSKSESRGQL